MYQYNILITNITIFSQFMRERYKSKCQVQGKNWRSLCVKKHTVIRKESSIFIKLFILIYIYILNTPALINNPTYNTFSNTSPPGCVFLATLM